MDKWEKEFAYKVLEDGTAEIVQSENYKEITGELVIPDSIDGHKVTSIGKASLRP